MGIGTNIQKILQNVSSMQRMITQIGTPQDNSQLQNQLHQIQHYTGQLAKDSSKQLKELNNYPPEEALDPRQWKLQRERLQADFTKALDNFQRAQRSAAQKEKDSWRLILETLTRYSKILQPWCMTRVRWWTLSRPM